MDAAPSPLHGTPIAASSLLSDEALVARLQSGDMEALDLLFGRYASSLLGLSCRITGSLPDAEDVVQDVFVGLPIAIRSYAESGQFEAWLRRVTVRTALMRLRRDVRRREVSLDLREPVDPSSTMFSRMALEDAISSLPTPLRVVFVLKEVGHYSHSEIAATLGIRRGTSEVRLYRAIRFLRRILRADP